MSQAQPEQVARQDAPPRGTPRDNLPGADDNMWIDLGRAFAGALIFSISLLMTMETWRLGFYMARGRLALFVIINLALLVGLAHYRGFHKTLTLRQAVVDAFVGYAVGVITGALFLMLFGVIEWGMSADEIVGMVAMQAISSSIGALLARGQLGGDQEEDSTQEERQTPYWAEIFLMVVGALFVAYTVAPTEEMMLIGYRMTPWHGIAAVLVSLIIMHAFVYLVEFRGQESAPEGTSPWRLFVSFTVVGYLAVFLTSLYLLWTFGRTDGVDFSMVVMYGVVLSVPGALGAAAARLIL